MYVLTHGLNAVGRIWCVYKPVCLDDHFPLPNFMACTCVAIWPSSDFYFCPPWTLWKAFTVTNQDCVLQCIQKQHSAEVRWRLWWQTCSYKFYHLQNMDVDKKWGTHWNWWLRFAFVQTTRKKCILSSSGWFCVNISFICFLYKSLPIIMYDFSNITRRGDQCTATWNDSNRPFIFFLQYCFESKIQEQSFCFLKCFCVSY